MTFIAPSHTTGIPLSPSLFGRRAMKSRSRAIAADEDRARRALGADPLMPSADAAGTFLERLARIALG